MSGAVAYDGKSTPRPLTSTPRKSADEDVTEGGIFFVYRIEQNIEAGTKEKKDSVVDLGNAKTTAEDGAVGHENVASGGTKADLHTNEGHR